MGRECCRAGTGTLSIRIHQRAVRFTPGRRLVAPRPGAPRQGREQPGPAAPRPWAVRLRRLFVIRHAAPDTRISALCVALARSTTIGCGVQIRYYMRVYQNAAGCRPSTCPALFRGRPPRPSVPGWPQSRRQVRLCAGLQACSFRAVSRGGSRRLSAGTTLVPDDGCRLLLGEPGAGGERLIEPGCAQPLAGLGHQIGLDPPQMRPCPQADPPA